MIPKVVEVFLLTLFARGNRVIFCLLGDGWDGWSSLVTGLPRAPLVLIKFVKNARIQKGGP